jgi:pimeloyl-ACP methyl ester carboxylesterase
MPSRILEGREIHYAEAGDGPPLVLVHGTLQDQRYWAPQMQAFGARFHVYALSMVHCWPGTWQDGGGFTIAQHTADVAGFIRSLGGRARLIGHSRGGHIAFRVASEHPELIEELVLAEPGGELDASLGGLPASGAQAAGFARAAAEIAACRIEDGLRIIAENTGGPGAWEKRPESKKRVSRDNARTLLGQMHENRLPFSLAAAQAITMRTLLVNGAQTQPQFITVIEALMRVIPDAAHVVIPNATHGMSADNPAAFNKAVLDFFG